MTSDVLPKYWAPSSPGDLADRWTILNLKVLKADTEAKRQACIAQLRQLVMPEYDATATAIVDALGKINEQLWALEDEVRALMAAPETPDTRARFVRAAKRVPLLNDTRAHLKARIDGLMGHAAHDVKTYAL